MNAIEALMKIVVKVTDVVALARQFREQPALAMQQLVAHVRQAATETIEQVLQAELELHLGEESDESNKKNGFRERSYTIKGIGTIKVRVPRDRKGTYVSRVVPPSRRYDECIERDLAALHLAGISTRMLALLSGRVLGVKVSPQEVSNSMKTLIPAAKRFLDRPLDNRKWIYLYVDGTNFRVRRSTTAVEPTLVVLGVDANGHKSVLSMLQGDKDTKSTWTVVFQELKARGMDASSVQLGIMDGLPGLQDAFVEAFPLAKTARCWVHKARNVFARVPRRYQAEFKRDWDRTQYASSLSDAKESWIALKERWNRDCADAVECMEKDLRALLVHYEFPTEHWDALRTTNPIERVNKEFKRRSRAMEQVGPDGLRTLLAFTALRLEFGWQQCSISASQLQHLLYKQRQNTRLEELTQGLLH